MTFLTNGRPGCLPATRSMPDSLPASDLLLLDVLVLLCWALAAGALAVWIIAFMLRQRRIKDAARVAETEEWLTGLVFDELAGQPGPVETYQQLTDWQHRVLLQVLQRVVGQITGEDQRKLVALMQRIGFLDTAIANMASRKATQRQSACIVLAHFDETRALGALQLALKDEDRAVRLTAARALLLKDRIDSLRSLLEDLDLSAEDPPLILTEIFSRLPARLEPEAVELLVQPIHDEWKRMLALALGRNQVAAAFDPIVQLTRAPSVRIRAAAWIALKEMGDPRTVAVVPQGVRDENANVRRAACDCAARFGEPAVVAQLLSALHDYDWWVRFAAANALCDTGPAGRAALERHCVTAIETDVGLQVLREREMEAAYGL